MFFTNESYQKVCDFFDINLIPVTSQSIKDYFLKNENFWKPRNTIKNVAEYADKVFFESIEKILHETKDSDLIISHPLVFSGKTASEVNSIKYAGVSISPICIKSNIRLPIFFGGLNFNFLPRIIKNNFYNFAYIFVIRKYFKEIPKWRKYRGLVKIKDPLHWGSKAEITIGLWSEWYCDVFEDQKEYLKLSGFTKNVEFFEGKTDPELIRWIKEKPTILITMGSGYLFIKKWENIIKKMSKTYDYNFLIITPENIISKNKKIKYVRMLSLKQILPLCDLCIHHGGAGMVTQTLGSGTPSIVVPMAHDQPDNGHIIESIGAGVVIWMKEPKYNLIAGAIDKVLSSKTIKEKAIKCKNKINKSKDGIVVASDLLEKYLN